MIKPYSRLLFFPDPDLSFQRLRIWLCPTGVERPATIPMNKKHEKMNNEFNIQTAFSVDATETDFRNLAAKDIWILDSRASKHMTFRSDWICNLKRYANEHVSLDDDMTYKVHGRGTVYIVAHTNTYHVPDKINK